MARHPVDPGEDKGKWLQDALPLCVSVQRHEAACQSGDDRAAAGRVVPAAQAERPGGFFRRVKARLGMPRAITATAHVLARLIYTTLKHGIAYVRQGMAEYEQHHRHRMVQSLTRRAQALAYALAKKSAGTSR
jgi:hypothetical protein